MKIIRYAVSVAGPQIAIVARMLTASGWSSKYLSPTVVTLPDSYCINATGAPIVGCGVVNWVQLVPYESVCHQTTHAPKHDVACIRFLRADIT